jgi:hypothetical protein
MPKPPRPSPTPDSLLDPLSPNLRATADALRAILRRKALGLEEGVKWNAPSYTFNGDDRVTFNLRGKGVVRLVFHCGVKKSAPRSGRLIDDPDGLLTWAANDRAIAEFANPAEVERLAAALAKLVRAWCEAAG